MYKRFALFGSGLLIFLLFIFALRIFNAQADTAGNWVDGSLAIQSQNTVNSLPSSLNGNIDCLQGSSGVCAVPTLYGSATSGGEVALNGSSAFYPALSYLDSRQHFIPVPNSNTVITYTTEPPYGFYIYFSYNFPDFITTSDNGNGKQYQINRPPDAVLADKDGHKLAADYTSFSFSANGRWMVVSVPGIAMVRVDLETFAVTPFARGFNYTIGLDPAPQTAISDDGRYAVVASKAFDRAAIYDLDSCTAVPYTIDGPAACQSRDLEGPLLGQIGSFISASNIRFIDDDDLSLYAAYGQPAAPTIARYIVSDNGGINQVQYLALGDSYISGEGAFDYQAGTDTDDNHCHVSLASYPYLLGHDLNFDSYHSVACSGAVIDDITDVSDAYDGQVKDGKSRQELSRTNELSSIKNNFSPGYIDQLDFVKTYQPQIVTVSVGGNDMGFSDILRQCIEPWEGNTCYNTYEDRLELARMINTQVSPKLMDTYQTLKAAGPPDMRLYVVGYPQIAQPGGDCAVNVHLNEQEIEFSRQLISYLDSAIQTAAARSGVYYVDTQHALDGHKLCEAGPGSVAVNGLTAGTDTPKFLDGPIGNESYHPNAFGHELLENAVLAESRKLTAPMPSPDPAAALPPEDMLASPELPHSGQPVDVGEYDADITTEILYKQSLNSVNIDGAEHSLSPGGSMQVSLHSDPTDLGKFTVGGDGNLSGQITIPDNIPAGYHTLHFYGTDLNGQSIDIYKVVYVADSPDDIDGDGQPDASEACVGVTASGQDTDHDGIDDSCDSTIDVATQESPATTIDAQLSGPTAGNASSQSQIAPVPVKSGDDSPNNPSPLKAQPKVLSARTSRAVPAGHAALSVIRSKPDSKILLAAGGACIWITICYAAYKFPK